MKGAAPPRTASKSCHLSLQTHCLLHGFPVPRSPSACRARAAESRSRSRAVAFRVSCVAEAVRPTFSDVKTEKEFLEVLTLALRHPRAPDFLLPAFQDFFNNYKGKALPSTRLWPLTSSHLHVQTPACRVVVLAFFYKCGDMAPWPMTKLQLLSCETIYLLGSCACSCLRGSHRKSRCTVWAALSDPLVLALKLGSSPTLALRSGCMGVQRVHTTEVVCTAAAMLSILQI